MVLCELGPLCSHLVKTSMGSIHRLFKVRKPCAVKLLLSQEGETRHSSSEDQSNSERSARLRQRRQSRNRTRVKWLKLVFLLQAQALREDHIRRSFPTPVACLSSAWCRHRGAGHRSQRVRFFLRGEDETSLVVNPMYLFEPEG